MRSRNQFHKAGSMGCSSKFLISSLRAARKDSVVIWSKAKPTMANCLERRPSCARLASAGMSLRLVRSPLAPNMTMTQGEAMGLCSLLSVGIMQIVLSQAACWRPGALLVTVFFLEMAAELKAHGGQNFCGEIIFTARREALE